MTHEDGTTPIVVVAEDNFLTAKLIVAALEEGGLYAEIGRDGDQVSRLISEHNPKVLLLSLNLLRPSGLELARILRLRQRGLKTIGFLNPGQADMKPQASSYGVELFVENPFDPEALVSHVYEMLGPTG